MADERITVNDRGDWIGPGYAAGLVDEIVVDGGVVHLEMTNDSAAHLGLVFGSGRHVTARILARPSTRAERRQILTAGQDRLRDRLYGLLPARWSHTWWSVPWYRRLDAAVREWWEAYRGASAVLLVRVDEDSDDEADT